MAKARKTRKPTGQSFPTAHMRNVGHVLNGRNARTRIDVEEFPAEIDPVAVHEYRKPGVAVTHMPPSFKPHHAGFSRVLPGSPRFSDQMTGSMTAWDPKYTGGIK
jgi:hypothetical protein